MKLSKEMKQALQILNYLKPTEVQQQVIPLILDGKNVIGKSQTGSGKTAAFGIPICEMVVWEENQMQALVLEPTRELTVQVKQELFHIGRTKRLKVADLFGGFPIDKQIQTLKQKNHIGVGTPGRILDHIERGSLNLSKLKILVIDEADLMLDMGFLEDVERILESVDENVQILLFSATIGDQLDVFIKQYLRKPERVWVESETESLSIIEQKLYEVNDAEDKYELFLQVLKQENPESAIIFCGTREMVNVLCRMLSRDQIQTGMIHGEIDQQDRIKTIENFRRKKFRFLICTDIAARGIDFEKLSHVFHYDFPTGKETYVHRTGRTGRKGNQGIAICFVTEADQKMRLMTEEFIGYQIPVFTLGETTDEMEKAFYRRQKEKPAFVEAKGAGYKDVILRLSISGGKKSKMRAQDIVGTICSIDGIDVLDIGMIDVRDSLTYVEIGNGKGNLVLDALQEKTIKGKLRKVQATKNMY
jgi:ATP-dependent RNA helicase DeaD